MKVEEEWHYKIFTKYGFKPITKEQSGFVRQYSYTNDEGFHLEGRTGASADYFVDHTNKITTKDYLHSDLEEHLKNITRHLSLHTV